ncbi:hypothetical protein [Streptomyces antimycoticus]|uniref:hypothetical protein n=1 Tax=Streptomyces antimycoticus TaxID=68175 RepID=UPI0036E9E1DB
MTCTDEDVREGRRLMDEGRDNRLSLGEKLLAVAGLNNDSVFEEFCGRIGLAPACGGIPPHRPHGHPGDMPVNRRRHHARQLQHAA